MDRRAFLQLFAAAGVVALAPQAFEVAEFIYEPESELTKLQKHIRASTFGSRLPDVIRLPGDVWDKVLAEMEGCRRFTNASLADQGYVNLLVCGVPIIRGGA